MEQQSAMDKKTQLRSTPPVSKNTPDPSKTGYDSNKKNGALYGRKRENDKIESKKSSNRGCRAGQRNVRPREKVGCQVESKSGTSEFGSLQKGGGKKQNITHLLNWWGPGPNSNSRHFTKYRGKTTAHSAKYSKEYYLHTNCQFIVASGHDYTLYENDPDHLIDWELVEEVRLHMAEAAVCPICLHPPVAAKVTRCGHIYCFACVLHYLALTDENWRKCPICFDVITLKDLKSATYILHKEFSCNQEIELKLMKRERDSLVPVPVAFSSSQSHVSPSLSNPDERLVYSKFIEASKQEVSKFIVNREIESLKFQLAVDGDEPEACFIKDALILASERDAELNLNSFLTSEAGSYPSLASEAGALSLDGLKLSNTESTLVDLFDGKVSEPVRHEEGKATGELYADDRVKDEIFLKEALLEGPANISAEDLDIGQLQESSLTIDNDVKGTPKQVFYFYQESSGAQIYLHALNIHMLVKDYGCLQNCPQTIKAKVLEKESDSMSESLRHRSRYLRHLPLSCPFEVVEIEMNPPLISELTKAEFQPQLEQRERKRKKRAKEEYRIEKRVQVQEDKLMGRSRGAGINMTSFKHFPSFTDNSPPASVLEDQTWAPRPSVSSVEGEFPNLSTPSFAQMTRCGQRKSEAWASANQSTSPRRFNLSSSGSSGRSFPERLSDEEFEEAERVPDFSAAFSNDFARALDQATKQLSSETPAQGNGQKGKKGKRKKGIVLLSSGGR